MFEGFLTELRARGVPVATDQWLVLQDALDRGLAQSSLSRFYGLARALCVTSEAYFDAYDIAFASFFGGVEGAPADIEDRVWQWLARGGGPEGLSPEDRARLDAVVERLGVEEIRRRLAERLENQDEAHHGGSRHIGTGGTSPFGHSGWHPGGFRLGGRGRHRTAVQVAAARDYRDYRRDTTLGVREMGLALRRLRRLSSKVEGPASELDVQGSIDATAEEGGNLRLVFRRPRRNAVRVVLLLDVGGSMDEHAALVSRLFTAVHQASHFRELTVRYFHNCVYDHLYETPELHPQRADLTLDLLARLSPEHRLVVVGDACMAPAELVMSGGAIDYWEDNREPGAVWLERLAARFPRSAWLNPVPRAWWDTVHGARTLRAVASILPMFELSIDGIDEAVDHLMTSAPSADATAPASR